MKVFFLLPYDNLFHVITFFVVLLILSESLVKRFTCVFISVRSNTFFDGSPLWKLPLYAICAAR